MKEGIDEFAQRLMQCVRDLAIVQSDLLQRPDVMVPKARRWKALHVDPAAIATIIPDVVDMTIFYLLDAIDTGAIKLKYVDEDSGRDIDLTAEGLGELAGWFIAGDAEGWRARFSKERFADEELGEP